MSSNINQIFTANPIVTNAATDLMYFGQSPYGAGDDAAMTFANFSAQFGAPFTPATLTRTDDSNVTLTLGGSPATSLLQAVSLTLGWTGTLPVSRGGTGAGSFTPFAVLCGGITSTSAFQPVAALGASGTVLTSNGAGALPTFQAASGGSSPFTQVGSFSVYGPGASATMGTSSLAVGSNAMASGNNAIAIGASATASGNNSVAIGGSTTASAAGAIMISSGASTASAVNTIGIGSNNCNSASGVAIGAQSATGAGQGQISIGNGASAANGEYCISIGRNAVSTAARCISLGYQASASNNGSFVCSDSSGTPAADTALNQWRHTFAGGFYFNLTNTSLAVQIDATGNLINRLGTSDQSHSLQTPATGFSITIANTVKTLVLNPAGTLATGTIIMPSAPINGQEVRVTTSQTITSLTVSPNSGQTITAAPATLAPGIGFAYIYNLSGTNWYRLY